MVPASLNIPVPGSNTSATSRRAPLKRPPVASTCPVVSGVNWCSLRGVSMSPAGLQVPVAGAYSSALFKYVSDAPKLSGRLTPPAVSTLPSGSTTRKPAALTSSEVQMRWSAMLPVALHVPVAGSYNSAEASDGKGYALVPPASSTRPSGSSAAAGACRPSLRVPVDVHVPDAGSNSSAEVHMWPQRSPPPATSTRPSCRTTAAGLLRGTLRGPVSVQVPATGSKISAEPPTAGSTLLWNRAPPITSTLPFLSSTAAWPRRGKFMFATLDQAPVPGSNSSAVASRVMALRSEEHTSELQSRLHLVCRLLLEKKKRRDGPAIASIGRGEVCVANM